MIKMEQIVNPDHFDDKANMSHQVSSRLDFCRDTGLITQDVARVIFDE